MPKCPIHRCGTQIDPMTMMCKKHWERLPKELTEEIARTHVEAPRSLSHARAIGNAVRWIANDDAERAATSSQPTMF